MPVNGACAADLATPPQLGAAGDGDGPGDGGVGAHPDIVTDLHLVINFDSRFDDGVPQGASIYGGVRPDLNIVFYDDASQLGNFQPLPPVLGKTVTVRADDGAGENDHPVSHPHAPQQGRAGPQAAIGADAHLLVYDATRVDSGSGADDGAPAHHDLGAHQTVGGQARVGGHRRRGVNPRLKPRLRVEQPGGFGVSQVGIVADQPGGGTGRRVRGGHDDRGGPGGLQEPAVTPIGEKRQVFAPGLAQGGDIGDDAGRIALQFRVDIGGDLPQGQRHGFTLPRGLRPSRRRSAPSGDL